MPLLPVRASTIQFSKSHNSHNDMVKMRSLPQKITLKILTFSKSPFITSFHSSVRKILSDHQRWRAITCDAERSPVMPKVRLQCRAIACDAERSLAMPSDRLRYRAIACDPGRSPAMPKDRLRCRVIACDAERSPDIPRNRLRCRERDRLRFNCNISVYALKFLFPAARFWP